MKFVDCGSHCGESVVFAKEMFGSDVTIYAFEPIPSLASELKQYWCGDPNITVIEAAVSNISGTANFYLSREFTNGSSLISTKLTGNLAIDCPIQVVTVRLADWISANYVEGEEMYVKLDVEGAEFIVLPDLFYSRQYLKISRLFVEWHDAKFPGHYAEQKRILIEMYQKEGVVIEMFQPRPDMRVISMPSIKEIKCPIR